MTNSVTTDTTEVITALSNLSWKKMNKAYSDALKKSLEPINKQTKVNLRKSGIKNVNKPYVSKSGKKGKSMLQGIKTSTFTKTDDGWGKVHIMGEFRLKWFEKGTKIRKDKKGKSHGRITPKWYFKQAVDSKEREVENTLDENIRKSIMKAWDKQK